MWKPHTVWLLKVSSQMLETNDLHGYHSQPISEKEAASCGGKKERIGADRREEMKKTREKKVG